MAHHAYTFRYRVRNWQHYNQALDTKACYESIGQRGAKATIPPRRNAKRMRCSTPPKQLAILNANLRQIQQQGQYAWRIASGYC